MGQALILLGVLSLVALFVNSALAFLVPGSLRLSTHITISIPTALLALFTQCMVIFYFVGTGSQVRKALRKGRDVAAELGRMRELRGDVLPWSLGAIGSLMVAVILAGGVHTGVLHPVFHWGPALATLGLHLVAVRLEILRIDENERLLNALAERLGEW